MWFKIGMEPDGFDSTYWNGVVELLGGVGGFAPTLPASLSELRRTRFAPKVCTVASAPRSPHFYEVWGRSVVP